MISEHPKKRVQVAGHEMAYVEIGEGRPILFLHGNPTSSYLWRNIMPHVAGKGRAIAPDLIGMGSSEKLTPSGPERYRFTEHRDFLDGFLDALGITEDVILVVHDWGSALGFDWARRHPQAVAGIAYMEAIVMPITRADFPKSVLPVFEGFRSDAGEKMVLEQNIFIEQILPGAILRDLDPEEMAVYRRPFLDPGEGRRPTLTWPRQIPLDGKPAETVEIVQDYAGWMAQNDIPKLFFDAVPGAILRGRQRDFCRSWNNQREVEVKGVHFVQEDSPDEIGIALRDWLTSLD